MFSVVTTQKGPEMEWIFSEYFRTRKAPSVREGV